MTDSLEIWEELVPRALAGREVELLEAGCRLTLRNSCDDLPVFITPKKDFQFNVFEVKVAHREGVILSSVRSVVKLVRGNA